MEPIINGGLNSQADPNAIKDGGLETFAADVIEGSRDCLVLVDFWAEWCGPCKQLTPTLEKVVRAMPGKVRLVKINVDQNQQLVQQLAQQLPIQSIPTIIAFKNGQPVDGFTGALPESQVRSFVEKHAGPGQEGPSPIEQALEQAQGALDGGDPDTAAKIYGQILQADAENADAMAGLALAALAKNDVEAAKQALDRVPDKLRTKAPIEQARAAVNLALQSEHAGEVADLQAKVDANPEDFTARYDLAVALQAASRFDDAAEQLLTIIRADRDWNEDAARKQLVNMFDAAGHNSDFTKAHRRKLSSVLFS